MDALSELAPNYTPYRYGFNNPVLFSDPSGLFETEAAARMFAKENDINDYMITSDGKGRYILTITAGEFAGEQFYEMEVLVIENRNDEGGGGGGGGSDSNSGTIDLSGLGFATAGASLDFGQNFMYNKDTWRSLEYGRNYSQRFHGNQYVTDKAVAKNVSRGFNTAGKALGAYNSYSIYQQHKGGEINDFQMVAEQGMNTFSTFGGTVGAAAGIGWELGRAVTTIPAYQRFKHETWLPWRQRNLGY